MKYIISTIRHYFIIYKSIQYNILYYEYKEENRLILI